MVAIDGHIQITYNIMENLDELGLAGPLTPETILIVSKNAIKGFVYVANYYMLQGLAADAYEWRQSVIRSIIFFTFLKNRIYIC